LAWKIEFDSSVEKDLKKCDQQTQRRIFKYLNERILSSNDPRKLGKPLTGKLTGCWRYRVGDYRIIAKLEDESFIVYVIRIGHRKRIYKRH